MEHTNKELLVTMMRLSSLLPIRIDLFVYHNASNAFSMVMPNVKHQQMSTAIMYCIAYMTFDIFWE